MPLTPHRRPFLTQLILLLTLVLTLATGSVIAAQDTATPIAPEQLEAVLPEWQDELQDAIAHASGEYTIDAEVLLADGAGAAPAISGSLTMTYTNTTGAPVDLIPFRLYANGTDEQGNAMRVENIHLNGVPVEPEFSDDQSTVMIELETPLAPDKNATVALDFITAVPVDERSHYGILNVDPESGTWALAHWYPMLAGWDPDRGWVLDPPSEYGDPIFSNTAFYELTLRTPVDWRVVDTGVVTEITEDGSVAERHIVTGPARDLVLILDNDYEKVERDVNGTTITSWFNPGEERTGEAVLQYAAQSLAYFNQLIGPYPYTTLELAPVDLFGAAGVEFPQLIYMASSYYAPDRNLDVPNSVDFTVAHEVLHQWWYSMVGNNQYDHAFIDEGLTNFMSSTLYFTDTYGPQAGAIMTARHLERPFHSRIAAGNDYVVDTPTDDFPSSSAYVFAAYTKAPLGFKAIYEEIGHDAFASAVQQYYENHRFSVASPDDLLTAFEDASGQELDDLWNQWFEEASGEDDV